MTQFLIDNAMLLAVIVISVVALVLPIINAKRYGPEVSPAQATVLINHKKAQLIDVRKPVDFRKGHVPGARNIPVDQIQNALGQLDRERPVVLVDQTGGASRVPARLLRGVGFKEVYILENGLLGWIKEKMPLE